MPAGTGWVVRVRCSDRRHGDFGTGSEDLEQRRQAFMVGSWTGLHQQHGADVVTVTMPGQYVNASADGAVTNISSVVLAVLTADCAPVVVAGNRSFGIAHVGWRGVISGVIPAVADAVSAVAQPPGDGSAPLALRAALGPVIRPACYEFGRDALTAVASAVDSSDVVAVTDWGTAALDLAAAVRCALSGIGVEAFDDRGLDTANDQFYSYRLRKERARQVTAARLEPLR